MNQEAVIKPKWAVAESIISACSTRQGGHSVKPFDSMNVGTHVGDITDTVLMNRQTLHQSLALPSEPVYLNQVHGTDIITDKSEANQTIADAVITSQKNKVLAIMTADCLPILLADSKGREIAALHCGWRSLCDGLIEKTLSAMESPKGSIHAWLGPAISIKHFEVGEEVVSAFKNNNRFSSTYHQQKNGRDYIDLSGIADMILDREGVSHVTASNHCTYTEKDLFFSYRRDKTTGRMVSLIWLT